MHDADRLDGVLGVLRELVGDHRRVHAVPPVPGHEVDLETEAPGHLLPQRREVAGLEGQHPIPGVRVLTSAASQAPVPEEG